MGDVMTQHFNPRPKPAKIAPDRQYMGIVKTFDCIQCGRAGPSDAHHCTHRPYEGEHDPYDRHPCAGRRSGDRDTIPLCKDCHQNGPSAIHKSKDGWRDRNGPDFHHIPSIRARVNAIRGEIDF